MDSIHLTKDDIFFVNESCTKKEAITLVAGKMIEANLVKEDYTQSMIDRDAEISTFLHKGIAIPHGTLDKRDSILKTGLKVLYCPNGVSWDEVGNTAYVIIGIATKVNEHLTVLRQLTRTILADDTLERIHAVKEPEDLLSILQR